MSNEHPSEYNKNMNTSFHSMRNTSDGSRTSTFSSNRKNAPPPITQLIIRSSQQGKFYDDTSVISETTYTTHPESTSTLSMDRTAANASHCYHPQPLSGGVGGRHGSRTHLDTENTTSFGSVTTGPHRVARMPFTDAYGDKGWYTGEVASGSGLPHGQGTLHYCDGRVCADSWRNGLARGGDGACPPPTSVHRPPPSYHANAPRNPYTRPPPPLSGGYP